MTKENCLKTIVQPSTVPFLCRGFFTPSPPPLPYLCTIKYKLPLNKKYMKEAPIQNPGTFSFTKAMAQNFVCDNGSRLCFDVTIKKKNK